MTFHYSPQNLKNVPERTRECVIIKETKKYITFETTDYYDRYHLNKETGEVLERNRRYVLKGVYITF